MARSAKKPELTLGNHIYLYRLLSGEIGVGKQTFLPKVEEALAKDRMTAEDLGFSTTRELLEALDDFIVLTIFKGGRIYATVRAQEAWDAALAADAQTAAKNGAAATKGNKPWKKKKKTDRTLKPVRPKRMKRETAQDGNADESRCAEAAAEGSEAAVSVAEQAETPKSEAPEAESPMPEQVETSEKVEASETKAAKTEAPAVGQAEAPQANVPEPTVQVPDSPGIALTVTYDPYTGSADETVLTADVPAPARNAEPGPAPASHREEEPEPASMPEPVSAQPHGDAGHAGAADSPAPAKATNEGPAADARSPFEQAEPRNAAPSAAAAPAKDQPRSVRAQDGLGPVPSPEALAGYPKEFPLEVYCPMDLIAELCRKLPFGTDAMRLLEEDYARAQKLELLRGTRSRLAFPLRIEHEEGTEPLRVLLRKRTGSALSWTMDRIE